MYKIPFAFLALLLLVTPACLLDNKPPAEIDDTADVAGVWVIDKGYQEDRATGDLTSTDRLNGVYFTFENGQFSSTIPGFEQPETYEFDREAGTIQLASGQSFEVRRLNGIELDMATTIQGFDFLFETDRTEAITTPDNLGRPYEAEEEAM